MTLQNSLANYSFLTLLGSMIFYWIETSFHGLNLVELVSKGKTNQPPFDSKKINWKLSTTSKSIFNFFGYTSPEQKVPSKSFSPIKKGSLAKYSLLLSNILLGLLLLLRWKESGHFPLSNLYESLMFLSWCFTGLHLYIDNYTSLPKFLSGLPFAKKQLEEAGSISSSLPKGKEVTEREVGVSVSAPFSSLTFGNETAKEGTSSPGDAGTGLLLIRGGASALTNSLGNEERTKEFQTELEKESEYNEFIRKLVGSITTPSALLTNAFATFTLPKEMQEVSPLVPALQSNWLMMHVTVMILSYAALILGSLMSIAFLIVTIPNNSSSLPSTKAASLKSIEEASFEESNRLLNLNSAQTTPIFHTKNSQTQMAFSPGINSSIAFILDNLSYRILGIGFPLLTIGILSGAVWANEAWGSYWSWDPKETWALLTWLIFAIYLHTRLSKGWEGQKPAIIASFGFVVVWMCYLGVNLIGEGLHSYGWIS